MITGNLVRDPESRTTNSGKTVCNFTVAVNRNRRNQDGKDEADFFRVSAWGKTGENCQKYLAKGRKVSVTGEVSVSTYQAQDGSTKASMEVFAQSVEFLSKPSGNADSGSSEPGGFQQVETDELPF